MERNHSGEDFQTYAGGAAATPCPRFELVPWSALVALTSRFELGEAKYAGKGCWNAISANAESALTREWVTARMNHCVRHAMHAIADINGLAVEADDDAGALLFGGAVLAEYNRLRKAGKKDG